MKLEQLVRRNLERLGGSKEQIDKTFEEFVKEFGPATLQQEVTDEEIKMIQLATAATVLDVVISKDPKARAKELELLSAQSIRASNKEN